MLRPINILVWFSPNKQIYILRCYNFSCNYDIGDCNNYGHILMNILHLHKSTFYSMSLIDYRNMVDREYITSLKYARLFNFKREIKKSISNKLIDLAYKIRNKE